MENGFARIRFGDVTDQEIQEIMKRGLGLNEENERYIRELLRLEQGMAAYAKLNLPRIDSALKYSDLDLFQEAGIEVDIKKRPSSRISYLD